MECEIKRFRNGGEKWIGAVGLLNGKPYEIFTGIADNLNLPDYVNEGKIVKVPTTVEEVNPDTGILETKKKSRYDIHYLDKEGKPQIVEGLSTVFKSEYYNYSKFISGLLRHGMPPIYVISTIKSLDMGDVTINSWKNGIMRVLKTYTVDGVTKEPCPKCGEPLRMEGGCKVCDNPQCGHSGCD